jgi:hypothetical protein
LQGSASFTQEFLAFRPGLAQRSSVIMYLVELRPGKEELYRTSDELALAIRNGDVDARSRIYHRATAKWISITLHPQYKAITTAAKEEPPARPVRRGWTFLGGIAPLTEPPQDSVPQMNVLQQWRRPLALGISGVLLLLGIQLAFSGPRPPWAGKAHATRTPASRTASVAAPRAVPPPEVVSLASRTTWSPEKAVSAGSVTSAEASRAAPLLPRAPRLRRKSLRAALETGAPKPAEGNTVAAMLDRYAAAYDSSRDRLESGMRVARLSRLFAAPRLSPNGGVTDTRMSLAGAANFIRIYRQQQAAIESAYQDSIVILAKRYRWAPAQVKQWYSREMRTENPELEVLSGSLIAGIDSILGVLDAQAGAYKIRGSAIAFEDPMAAQAYGTLRRQIKQQVDAAVAAGGATSPGPTGLLLRAIGTTSLPRET